MKGFLVDGEFCPKCSRNRDNYNKKVLDIEFLEGLIRKKDADFNSLLGRNRDLIYKAKRAEEKLRKVMGMTRIDAE